MSGRERVRKREKEGDGEGQMLGLETAGKQVLSNPSNEKQLVTKGFA